MTAGQKYGLFTLQTNSLVFLLTIFLLSFYKLRGSYIMYFILSMATIAVGKYYNNLANSIPESLYSG